MIDEKKIEEAAEKYADDTTKINTGLDWYDHANYGFREGAKWAIQEFLKDLWHPAIEEPREFTEILAEAKITESINTYLSFKRNDALFENWAAYSSCAKITRWLYVDDLFPKKGGEE